MRCLSARAVRRPAPARDDRHGARQRSRHPDRRRADDGARRDHPGADPGRCSPSCRRGSAWRSCSSPTTSASSAASPTGSMSCSRGEVVEDGRRPRRSSPRPQHPYTQDAARRRADRHARRRRRPTRRSLLEGRNVEVDLHASAAASSAGAPIVLRAVDRVSLTLQRGPDDRHRRRIRLRQVDARPRAPAPAAERGRDPLRGPRHLAGSTARAMRPLRRELQLVFQDPFGSLSPRMTVGQIVTEGLLVHEPALSRKRARPPRRRGARGGRPRSRRCATATRTNSPAASASASPSPAP